MVLNHHSGQTNKRQCTYGTGLPQIRVHDVCAKIIYDWWGMHLRHPPLDLLLRRIMTSDYMQRLRMCLSLDVAEPVCSIF